MSINELETVSQCTCADPESFARVGPTLTMFFWGGFLEEKEDPNSTKSGPSSVHQLNAI